jgi:uncharacterized metal-binding protein YceD (DUF177 family)
MPIRVNIRHLVSRDVRLHGELSVAELDIEHADEVIHLRRPLQYDMEVELLEDAVLARGRLQLTLDCDCVRCLKPVLVKLDLDDWACHLPLGGDDKVAVTNDSVDLTPYVREDILLAFPQHPLCKPDCSGLLPKPSKGRQTTDDIPEKGVSSAWTELDKLKL